MLRELLADASNDYSQLEERYRASTGAELVLDPFGSYAVDTCVTRSATVLVGSHNSRDTLPRALESLAGSTFNRRYPDQLEVVVVDDGSTDGTWELLGGLELDLRLRCVRQERGGLARAHNTGLAFAGGDVVVFSDADVVHTPHALEELMKRHETLRAVTLLGFRFDIDPAETRPPPELVPAFWSDFRLSFPGLPSNMCRETRHLKDLGHGRRVAMSNGAQYDLPSFVVGAFFSIERDVLLAMGGSEERLRGWGCEDSLIGARSIALGNFVVPVYGAVSAHVAHARRDSGEHEQFARNIATALEILDEPFAPPGGDAVPSYARRGLEWFEREPSGGRGTEPPAPAAAHESDDHAGTGLVAWSLGLYTEAASAYRRASDVDPTSVWPLLGVAKSLRELGDDGAALEAFAEARQRDPANAWVAWEHGLLDARSGRHAEARTRFAEALRLAPGFFEPEWALRTGAEEHKRRGNLHAAASLHAVAVRDFDLSLALESELPWTHFDRGLSLRALGRGDEALAALGRAEALLHPEDANRAWIHSALGDLRLERCEYASAKLELERARRLFPESQHVAASLTRLTSEAEAAAGLACTLPLLGRIAEIPGWLTDGEADILSAAVARAAALAEKTGGGILELGSFYGRSTVTIGLTLCALGSDLPFTAVDPHEGYHFGGVPESYSGFIENLRLHGLEQRVDVRRVASHELEWDAPLVLLFVDALHDYDNVKRDHELFERFVVPGGLIAFHDYDSCCPDVERYVDEVLAEGELELAGHRDKLIVLRQPAGSSRSTTWNGKPLTANV